MMLECAYRRNGAHSKSEKLPSLHIFKECESRTRIMKTKKPLFIVIWSIVSKPSFTFRVRSFPTARARLQCGQAG